jgi:hypothetical protein
MNDEELLNLFAELEWVRTEEANKNITDLSTAFGGK